LLPNACDASVYWLYIRSLSLHFEEALEEEAFVDFLRKSLSEMQ
jgi:hypothetical protein